MRDRLGKALGIAPELVNISATTTEKMGVTGEGKAIAAAADVLIRAK